jgi:hypothetical protein
MLVVGARRRAPAARAAMLAAAGGCVYACSGGLLKQATAVVAARGLVHAFAAPSTWGFLGIGFAGTVLVQSAFQVGELAAAVTALTATEPLAGGLVGVVVFGERLRTGASPVLAVVAAAGCAMVATAALVARSPLLTAERPTAGTPGPQEARATGTPGPQEARATAS